MLNIINTLRHQDVNRPSIYDELGDLIRDDSGQRFAGDDFRILNGPGVYMFMLDGLPLYIGMSATGVLCRASNPKHAQAERSRQRCDAVHIYPCRTASDAKRLERLLIKSLHPAYNKQLVTTTAAQRLALPM